jgi:hypothetical protein
MVIDAIIECLKFNSNYSDLTLKELELTPIILTTLMSGKYFTILRIEGGILDISGLELIFLFLALDKQNRGQGIYSRCNLRELTIENVKSNLKDLTIDSEQVAQLEKLISNIVLTLTSNNRLRVLKLSFLQYNELLNYTLKSNYFLFDSNFRDGKEIHERNRLLYKIIQKNSLFLLLVKRFNRIGYISRIDVNILIYIGKLVFEFRKDGDSLKELEESLKSEK